MSSRLGFAALVLALIANVPLLAASIIGAILVSGVRRGAVDALGELLVAMGPIVPGVYAGLGTLALILGIAATVKGADKRDGIAAIVIVAATPIVVLVVLGAAILL